MNQLLENGQLQEMICGSNFAYIVADNTTFLPTEYKVLQGQGKKSFVKCMKMLFNGKTQLYYLTEGYSPLTALLPRLDAENFLIVVYNLLGDVLEVQDNGFLNCANIDISFDKIFVDPTTYKVKLVYLPLSSRLFDDVSAFENELRSSFIKLISTLPSLTSPKMSLLSSYLQNATLSLRDLYNKIGGGKTDPVPSAETTVRVKIVALNAPERTEIEITKDEFILGRKQGLADGVIAFNRLIGRSHCKILRRGSQYFVVDLQSQNGTYLNKVRLQPNRPAGIKNGDVIRLANSDFQVVFG